MKIKLSPVVLSIIVLFSLLTVGRLTSGQAKKPSTGVKPQTVAFVNVNVVPMDRDQVLSAQTVVVRDGRIAEIGPAAKVPVPEGALQIDGQGKYLIPGLVDMHVHGLEDNWQEEMFLYIANGVTTVRHLKGQSKHLKLREQVAKGEVFGPTLYVCQMVFGDQAKTPEDARRVVAEQAKAGYDGIKVYSPPDWTQEGYEALTEAANSRRLPVIGHFARNLPLEVNLRGRTEVAHAEEYLYTYFFKTAKGDWAKRESLIPEVARATKEAGVAVTATLVAYDDIGRVVGNDTFKEKINRPELKYLPKSERSKAISDSNSYRKKFKPEEAPVMQGLLAFQKKLVKGLQVAGVKILLGTDGSFQAQTITVPGFSAHEELRELVDAGLTPFEALQAGTVNAAEILKASSEFGTVTVGKRADLILLEGNPLENIAHAARRAGVMVRGQWMPEAELQKKLDAIAASFAK